VFLLTLPKKNNMGYVDMKKSNGYGVLLVSMVIVFSFIVSGFTRTITDNYDTVDTLIRNSNGKYWTATGDNIQLAVDGSFDSTSIVRDNPGYNYNSIWPLYSQEVRPDVPDNMTAYWHKPSDDSFSIVVDIWGSERLANFTKV
jgi:hypothetical protein